MDGYNNLLIKEEGSRRQDNHVSMFFLKRQVQYLLRSRKPVTMIDDQDLGFIANFLGIFIFALVIAYHYVTADPKYEGN
ncbi:hypothetical protein LWI29_030126 [Acer saccharum]|uniref:Dolichyl-diphosphooligosaccharide--protein glycosyltransferase subunit 4A n=1 Tax=Acer saccharum TaxID=4024 RepID=A0AA39S5G5_ACESA|nr:hypothetical protein LWI29_030126 [Acer saccharum]